jgi:hypothetical protein
MTKVYCVMEYPYHTKHLVEIFSTKEKAEAYAKQDSMLYVEEVEVKP